MALVWQQWVDGWDGSPLTGTGCSVSPGTNNDLTATIASATDGSDRAVEVVSSAAKLPSGSQGYLRDLFITPSSFSLSNNSTILLLLNSGGKNIVDVFFTSALKIGVFADIGVLASGSVDLEGSGPVFISNAQYIVEVWWQQNSALKLAVNGATIYNQTGLAGSTLSGVPTSFRQGIDHYDGVSVTGWTALHRLGQMGDAFTDKFADPFAPSSPVVTELNAVKQAAFF